MQPYPGILYLGDMPYSQITAACRLPAWYGIAQYDGYSILYQRLTAITADSVSLSSTHPRPTAFRTRKPS